MRFFIQEESSLLLIGEAASEEKLDMEQWRVLKSCVHPSLPLPISVSGCSNLLKVYNQGFSASFPNLSPILRLVTSNRKLQRGRYSRSFQFNS